MYIARYSFSPLPTNPHNSLPHHLQLCAPEKKQKKNMDLYNAYDSDDFQVNQDPNHDFDDLFTEEQWPAVEHALMAVQHQAISHQAAIRLQALARGYIVRHTPHQAAIRLQALARGYIARHTPLTPQQHNRLQQLQRCRIAQLYSFEDSTHINHLMKEDQREANRKRKRDEQLHAACLSDDQDEARVFLNTRGMTLDQLANPKRMRIQPFYTPQSPAYDPTTMQ